MYYPVGCPRILDGRGATGGSPLLLLRHRTKNLMFELREHSLAVWHTRVRDMCFVIIVMVVLYNYFVCFSCIFY